MSLMPTRSLFLLALLPALAARANTSADAVLSYSPGSFTYVPFGSPDGTPPTISPYQNGGAPTLGLPSTLDGPFDPINDVTPFTAPYDSASLTLVNPGGQLTLHLAQPVSDLPGPDLGIFANPAIAADGATSTSNNVVATDGPFGFSPSAAIVSVSATPNPADFIALNGGAPITFNIPTNAFLNSSVTYDAPFVDASAGTSLANPYKPFSPANGLASFSGLSYSQMLALLNGSAGGTWLDFSSTGLPTINYIQFTVPSNATYSLTLDAVTAAPEPTTLTLLTLTPLILLHRRRPKNQ